MTGHTICGCGLDIDGCITAMDHDGERCCWCCDHPHDLATLARYGLLES
jgi:hypothetical protein